MRCEILYRVTPIFSLLSSCCLPSPPGASLDKSPWVGLPDVDSIDTHYYYAAFVNVAVHTVQPHRPPGHTLQVHCTSCLTAAFLAACSHRHPAPCRRQAPSCHAARPPVAHCYRNSFKPIPWTRVEGYEAAAPNTNEGGWCEAGREEGRRGGGSRDRVKLQRSLASPVADDLLTLVLRVPH